MLCWRLMADVSDSGMPRKVPAGDFYSLEQAGAKLEELASLSDEPTICDTYSIHPIPREMYGDESNGEEEETQAGSTEGIDESGQL